MLRAVGSRLAAASRERHARVPSLLRRGLLLRRRVRQLPDQLRVPVDLRDARAGNPEPETRNPKPETRNPKPET
jgi:hypothetical protein